MWLLMENNIDEVKVLQTAALLLTTNNLVRGESLSKVCYDIKWMWNILFCYILTLFINLQCLVLCFRLHFAKDTTIGNTAGATVRQLVSLVFERVVIEDASSNEETVPISDDCGHCTIKEFPLPPGSPQKMLKPFAQDALSLFEVICLFSFAKKMFMD